MSCPIVVRAVTAAGNSVLAQQRVIDAHEFDILKDVFAKLDIRFASDCIVFANALALPDSGTCFSEHNTVWIGTVCSGSL
jgi:hypothetical protein